MRSLRFLLKWFNPTVVWEEDAARPLLVDLDGHHCSGVRVGDPVESLAFLGPGKVNGCLYSWPHKGVTVMKTESLIHEMGFSLGHPADPTSGTFVGSFQYNGVPVLLSRETTEAEVVSLFGPPYWRDQDDEEIILFYEFPGLEWQLEFDVGGGLKYMQLCRPLLASAEQRASYGVTRPWPPVRE